MTTSATQGQPTAHASTAAQKHEAAAGKVDHARLHKRPEDEALAQSGLQGGDDNIVVAQADQAAQTASDAPAAVAQAGAAAGGAAAAEGGAAAGAGAAAAAEPSAISGAGVPLVAAVAGGGVGSTAALAGAGV